MCVPGLPVSTTERFAKKCSYGEICSKKYEKITNKSINMMSGTMAGGNQGPGRPEKNWVQCPEDDLRVFQATEGSTESSYLLLGVGVMAEGG